MFCILEYLKRNILSVCALIIAIISLVLNYTFNNKEVDKESKESVIAIASKDEEVIEKKEVNVDIKGAVKKAGVYRVSEDSIVNDVVKLAGLTSNATTIDINLSKGVKNEMVIYVSTKSEYNAWKNKKNNLETTKVSDTINDAKVSNYNNTTFEEEIKETVKENTSTLVNINSATKEELQKLNGLGQSKAESIISYRNQNGPFKSIEDIQKVSGIGDSVYAKIKDYITI